MKLSRHLDKPLNFFKISWFTTKVERKKNVFKDIQLITSIIDEHYHCCNDPSFEARDQWFQNCF